METQSHPYVALDAECANLSGAPHLVEIGAVRIVDGEVEDHFQTLIAPAIPIEPAATAVHGITDDDIRSAPTAAEALTEFFAWIGAARLVAHNARADANMIGFECARAGLQPPDNPLYDSLALARKALPDAPDHQLATLVEYLELDVDDAHRALPDAVACWQVFESSLARLDTDDGLSDARLAKLAGLSATLASSLPDRPNRRPAQLRKLESARLEERSVILTYGAGSAVPARMKVTPRLLFRQRDKSYLEGECSLSGVLKTYRLDRIHRVESSN